MIIPSEVAKSSRYGEDALEAFYTAVDNGQARLAMSILVDVIVAFADKIEALENASAENTNEIKPQPKEAVKVESSSSEEDKPAAKQKVKDSTAE